MIGSEISKYMSRSQTKYWSFTVCQTKQNETDMLQLYDEKMYVCVYICHD